ncbi:MAG: AbrB/MazE/SpoVT family DNA-binding domain-containing protein [Candidatus Aenigmarchaeota archaeon]|nr:AbrB/MazE/SpoVT family DNA-binding domain-containing protein [Candidatus Aenigmarchaeota archaeon]
MTDKYFIKRLKVQGEEGERQLSVGIPNEIMEKYGLNNGGYVAVKETDKGIVIKKIDPEKLELVPEGFEHVEIIEPEELKGPAEFEPFPLKELDLPYSSDLEINYKRKE